MSQMIPDSKSIKSFWEKPEGKIGMVFTAIFLAGGALIVWSKLLPWLISLAANSLFLALILIVLGIVVFPFTQRDFRLKLTVGYKLFLKRLASFIIKTDPIGILKYTIAKGEDRLEMFEEQRSKLKQVLSNLKRKINEYSSQAKESMLAAKAAEKQQIKSQVYLNANQAGRLQGAATELSQVSTRLDALYSVITKISENAKVLLLDRKQEVSLMEDKWIAIRAAYSAMQSAMKALNGDKDERALFEEAADYVNNDLGMKIGEIEYMLEASETIMDSIDVRNGMFQEKGMKMLEEFEKKADSWLLVDNDNSPKLQMSQTTGQVVSNNVERPNQFSDLFSK
jgi:hypothetical protein